MPSESDTGFLQLSWHIPALPKALQHRQLEASLEDIEGVVLARVAEQPQRGARLYLYAAEQQRPQVLRDRVRKVLKRLGITRAGQREAKPGVSSAGTWQQLLQFLALLLLAGIGMLFLFPAFVQELGYTLVISGRLQMLLASAALVLALLPALRFMRQHGRRAMTGNLPALTATLSLVTAILLYSGQTALRLLQLPPEWQGSYTPVVWLAVVAAFVFAARPALRIGKSGHAPPPTLAAASYLLLYKGQALAVPATLLRSEDVIRLQPGEYCPAGGLVLEGQGTVVPENAAPVEIAGGAELAPGTYMRDAIASVQLVQGVREHLPGRMGLRLQKLWQYPARPFGRELFVIAGCAAGGGLLTVLGWGSYTVALGSLLLLLPLLYSGPTLRRRYHDCLRRFFQRQCLPGTAQDIATAAAADGIIVHEQAFHLSTPWEIRHIVALQESEENILRFAASLHQHTPLALTRPLTALARERRLRLLPVAQQQCLPAAGYLRGICLGRVLVCVPEAQLGAEGFALPALPEETAEGERFFLIDSRRQQVLGCIAAAHASMAASPEVLHVFDALALPVWVVRYASPDLATPLQAEEGRGPVPLSALLQQQPGHLLVTNPETALDSGGTACRIIPPHYQKALPESWCLFSGNLADLAAVIAASRDYLSGVACTRKRHAQLYGLSYAACLLLQPPLAVMAALVMLFALAAELQGE